MNKILKINYCLAAVLLLMLSACLKKELGDYNPNGVNDLTIGSNLQDAYLVNVDDILKLDATVAQSEGGGNLTYQWYYYDAAGSVTGRKVVSNAAKLEFKIDMPTGLYYLVAETTDTKTGVKGYKKIALTVKRFTSEGWLLLTWKDNKTNLSIVSSANEVLKSFLKPSTAYPLDFKPEKLFCYNDWAPAAQPIVIKTSEPKLFFLDHNTFEVHSDGADAFVGGLSSSLTHFGSDMYFNVFYVWDANGAVYQTNRGTVIDYPSGFNQPLLGNYRASRFVLPVSSGYPVPAVFYDEQGKRFLYQDYGGNTLKPFQAKPASAPFDVNNFTDEIKFTGLGASDMTYIVAKNTAGDYILYRLELNNALNVYPAMAADKLDLKGNGAPTFYTLSGKLPLLYYILNNELYVYKMGEKRSTMVYSFPTDEAVSALSMLGGSPWFTSTNNPAVENRLGIATNKGAEGVFYTFDLSATGLLKTGKYTTRNDGFDPIIDIAYKMQK
uniref:PKD-like family lipoprotein n=1 Tax=Pedobacter schmidteae TaxID=2201271 RepID=UPI000EB40528|nr:PKD-like family lipoprotein [Pedobacter schmidteae]